VDDRALADLQVLAARDADLAGGAERLRELDQQVAVLRERAETIDAFFAAYPEEERRRREAADVAQRELGRRQSELAEAEQELAAARETEARERAESVVGRSRDHVAVAEATLARATEAAAELEREAASVAEEVPLLEKRARTASAGMPRVPPPADGLRDLVEWASHAHAELFVAAGQLDAQRERVIREANELATMLLGEPTYGSTVGQLTERVLPLAGK
jgi:chromosome segregation ATPase